MDDPPEPESLREVHPRYDSPSTLHMILVLDNRDSFTFNLVQALLALGETVEVRSSRETSIAAIERLAPDKLLIGPGPGRPEAAGVSLAAIRSLSPRIPTLGVCLGHQAIGACFGARVERSPRPLHGYTVAVEHEGTGLFHGLPTPLSFTRYNSLTVAEEGLPDCLEVVARAADGEVMALAHRTWPLAGVQFHPESILSERGAELFTNFLERL